MANIFGGQPELPDWMRGLGAENRKVAGQFGETLGTSLAAGLMVASGEKGDPDPMTGQAQPLSFGAAYQRARMNQVDPLWGLKAQQMKINAQDAAFKMQAQSLALRDASEEREARLEDLPTVREWMKQPDTEAKWKRLPDVKSQWARGEVDARVKQHEAKELTEQKLANQRLGIDNQLEKERMIQEGMAQRLQDANAAKEKLEETKQAGRFALAKSAHEAQEEGWKHRMEMLKYTKLEAGVQKQALGLMEKAKELSGQIKSVIASNDSAADKAAAIEKLTAQRKDAFAQYDSLVSGASSTEGGDFSALPPKSAVAPGMVAAERRTPSTPPKAASGKFRYDPTSGKIVPITE